MRILLTANASYLPPRGGATRSNLIWLEHLAGHGHTRRVVASALADAAEKRGQIENEDSSDEELRQLPAEEGDASCESS